MRRRQRLFYALEDGFNDERLPAPEDGRRARGGRHAAQAHKEVYEKAFDLPCRRCGRVRRSTRSRHDASTPYGGTAEPASAWAACWPASWSRRACRCVEVDLGGWDNHADIFSTLAHRQRPATSTRAWARLVKDLVDRGKWKDTVVVWMGEFGRTPRINQNGGRDHWGRVLVGGGRRRRDQGRHGLRRDRQGRHGRRRTTRCTIGDLFATMYKGLGIDPATQGPRQPRPAARDRRGQAAQGPGVIDEPRSASNAE